MSTLIFEAHLSCGIQFAIICYNLKIITAMILYHKVIIFTASCTHWNSNCSAEAVFLAWARAPCIQINKYFNKLIRIQTKDLNITISRYK